MNRYLILAIILSGALSYATAQKSVGKLELGLNVSNVIASTFNTSSNILSNDPYTIIAKVRMNQNYLRIGGYVTADSKNDFRDFDHITVNNKNIGLKIGIEKRKLLLNKLELIYGLDLHAIYHQRESKVVIFNTNEQFTTTDNAKGFGASPFLGMKCNLGSLVSVSVEAFVLGELLFKNSKLATAGSSEPVRKFTDWRVQSYLPQSIYFYMIF